MKLHNKRNIDNALTPERLQELVPSTEELFENTWRATRWYEEAFYTGAALFVEAAEQSDQFREDFVKDKKEEVEHDSDYLDETYTYERDVWRETMQQECPELYEELMGLELSAFQGGNAEKLARGKLRGTDNDNFK